MMNSKGNMSMRTIDGFSGNGISSVQSIFSATRTAKARFAGKRNV